MPTASRTGATLGEMRRALIVIGKAPLPGRTKTRLAPPLSAEGAATLYRAFLLDTLALALSLGWEHTSLVHPGGHGPALRALVPNGIHLLEQTGAGLGDALGSAFERQFAEGCDSAILVGSDNPTLPAEAIVEAQTGLDTGADVTIGPSLDGGYYLIGMKQPRPCLFQDIDWSTPRVYQQTLNHARELGLRVSTVRPWYDVDEPADLERLRRDLHDLPLHIAVHTRAAVETTRAAPAR